MSKLDTMLEEAYRQRMTTDILESLAGLSAPDAPMIKVPGVSEEHSDISDKDIPEASNKAVDEHNDTCNVVDISDKVLEGLEESDSIDEILDILEENGYELTMENVEALIEGLSNGSIGIVEDNLDLSKDEMDKTVSNADVGIMPRDDHPDDGSHLKKPEAVYDYTDDNAAADELRKVLSGEIAPETNSTGDDTTPTGKIDVDIDISDDGTVKSDDPLKESFDEIFAVLSSMKLSEDCVSDIDAEVVSGGGLSTGDGALVKGTEAGDDDACGNLVSGKAYIPCKAKKDCKPKTIKEALMLTPEYFQESSYSVVTPEMKEDRLKVQLALRIAKEKMDPMFEELRKAATEAKKLQDALVEKYSSEASEKSDKITGKEEKKDEE